MSDAPDGRTLTAPVYAIDEHNRIINRGTGIPVRGMVAFGAAARLIPDEDPLATLRRWSEMRQSTPETQG